MLRMIKADSLLLYLSSSLLLMDCLFRFLTIESPKFFDFVVSAVFSISLSFLIFFIVSFFKRNVSFVLSIIFLCFIAILYSSQFLYFQVFKTLYSAYSAGNVVQLLDFRHDLTGLAYQNGLWIFLFFLPGLFIFFFGKKLLIFEKASWVNRLSLVTCIILAQATGIVGVYAGGKDTFSSYDLYFNNSYPIVSAEKIGLITTMRVDLQRLLLGWSPPLEVTAPSKHDSEPPEKIITEEARKNSSRVEKLSYNTLNIDFPKFISEETDPVLKDMHQYFSSVKPTEKNEFTGLFKDYNLIFITAEGFSPFAVREDVTPTLYKLVHQGYRFTNFYTPIWGVSTSDGEYVACTGLIPKSGVWSFEKSAKNLLPFVMGTQLKRLGYKTVAYHNHTYSYYRRDLSHPNMGYEYKGLGNGLQVKDTWPESDLEMFEKTVPEYISSQPFHAYYMTVSGHMLYTFTGNQMAWKNKKHVEHLQVSEEAKAYIATQIELDLALKHLLVKLEEAGIADKTLIALSADHYPYGLNKKTIDELAGHKVEENFELFKNEFILYSGSMTEPKVIHKPASSLDIIPTLSNLLGLQYDSRLLMGTDIFSDSEPLVVFMNKSFITDNGRYNTVTKEFTPAPGVEVSPDYVKQITGQVAQKFYYSAKILDTDYYQKIGLQ